jgi:hypothetical protein
MKIQQILQRLISPAVKVVVVSIAISGLYKSSAAQTAQLNVRGQVKYVHGINIGWFFGRCGNDIGKNPLHLDWGTGYDPVIVNKWLVDIKNMKCNVARVWLFENCEGLEFDANGYVSGIQPYFLTNLDDLLAKTNSQSLALELCFLNHTLNDQFGQTIPSGPTIQNFVTNTTARQKFLDNAVGPIVSRYNGNQAVFAYDVMNEGDLATTRGVCTQAELRTLIQATRDKIKGISSTVQVTCSSSGWKFGSSADHQAWFGGLNLDYYEYHSYATNPNLPNKPSWVEKPLLLGEYGPTLPSPQFNGSTWNALDQDISTGLHIEQARDRGYAGSLSWMYFNSPGNGENITEVPGGTNAWENAGYTIQYFGNSFFGPIISNSSIYLEALSSDWQDWSWGGSVVIADTTRAYAGTRSIKVNSTAGYGAFSARKGTAQSTAGYSKLRFYLYTPTSSRSFSVQTQTTDTGGAGTAVTINSAANAWKEIIIPLSSLGNPGSIKKINIKNFSASAIGNHWIDNIELIP